MSDVRPLNPEEPFYTWEIAPERPNLFNPDEPWPAGLNIYSECCADRFSPEEELVLLQALAERHNFTLTPKTKETP